MARNPVAAGEHTAWLLELGASVRAEEERSMPRGLGGWSSRRARARARRALVRARLEATAAVWTAPDADREAIDHDLLGRISVYTHAEPPEAPVAMVQPVETTSLRMTETGPGSAWPTTQTENR